MLEGGKMPCWSPVIAAFADEDAMAHMRLEDVSAALEVSQRLSGLQCHHMSPFCEQCPIKRSSSPLCCFVNAVTEWYKEDNIHTIRVSRICKGLAAG